MRSGLFDCHLVCFAVVFVMVTTREACKGSIHFAREFVLLTIVTSTGPGWVASGEPLLGSFAVREASAEHSC